MIFVDTSAWFASVVPSDPDHTAATHWLGQNAQLLITTDYIVDETLTLLKARGELARAVALGDRFFDGVLAELHYVTPDEIESAWQIFREFSDKQWSFTDCTSKLIIEALEVQQAFCFDHHFLQFGSVDTVP